MANERKYYSRDNKGSKGTYLTLHIPIEIGLLGDIGQGAAKISEVKVGGPKKYLPISPVQTHVPGASQEDRYFFGPPTLTSDIFAAS